MQDIQQSSGPIQRATTSLVSSFMTQVYGWMLGGLATTALVAFFLATQIEESPRLANTIAGLILPVSLIELALVVWISARAGKMSPGLASALFILYSALNGLFFSTILVTVATDIVFISFASTAGTFGVMALYGYATKQDLTKFGNIALMGLFGLIIASIVNLFMQSEGLYWIITYLGVGVFVVLTAYDTQKLKSMANEAEMHNIAISQYAINGALTLYLDFINLFLFILRIFMGSSSD